jgi:WD40 repeat protein
MLLQVRPALEIESRENTRLLGERTMAGSSDLLRQGIAFILAVLTIQVFADGVSAQGKAKIEIVPILGHSTSVTSVAFSPDGARVLSGGGDGTIKLWDAAAGALVRTIEARSAWVTSVAYSPFSRSFGPGRCRQTRYRAHRCNVHGLRFSRAASSSSMALST